MKVYEVGEQGKPVLMLLPGTGCYWRSNFGKVIEPLAETFRVACVSYDGFDETEQTQFPTMIEETAKIEEYIKEHYDGKICAAYGCSLGGSFVGLMAARGVIHMDYGILGGSDLDQSAKLPAKLMTALMLPMIYPFLTTGRFRLPFLNRKLEKWRKAGDGYVDAFIGMMRGAGVDLSFITKESPAQSVLFGSDYAAAGCDRSGGHRDPHFICLKDGRKIPGALSQAFCAPGTA